jgi:hypothetical protein
MPEKPAPRQAILDFGARVEWISDALREMANAASCKTTPAVLEKGPECLQTAMANEDHQAHTRLAEMFARISLQIEIMHAALVRLVAPQPTRSSITGRE